MSMLNFVVVFSKLGKERNLLNLIKFIYKNPKANIFLNGYELKVFP